MLGEQHSVEVESPNGAVYRYTTNMLDEKSLNDYVQRLEEASKKKDQELFDSIWNELTKTNSLHLQFEDEFKKLHTEFEKFIGETDFFSQLKKPKPLSQESIDDKIKLYEAEIAKLQNMKENIDVEKKKADIEEKVRVLRAKLDEKLGEFSEHLDNEEKKKELSDELTEIHKEITKLEHHLKNL